MKVIQELVAHFDRRGRLSRAQIRRLLQQGFLAADAPANMVDLAQPVGATYYFRVTGDVNGPCWGTDVYTGDTSIAVAAVHMGLVEAGMSVIVRVEAVSPPAAFQGSARHGVTSHDFGRYGSAYRLAAV
jgi:LCCL domain